MSPPDKQKSASRTISQVAKPGRKHTVCTREQRDGRRDVFMNFCPKVKIITASIRSFLGLQVVAVLKWGKFLLVTNSTKTSNPNKCLFPMTDRPGKLGSFYLFAPQEILLWRIPKVFLTLWYIKGQFQLNPFWYLSSNAFLWVLLVQVGSLYNWFLDFTDAFQRYIGKASLSV